MSIQLKSPAVGGVIANGLIFDLNLAITQGVLIMTKAIDLRMEWHPAKFDEFWNYPNPTYNMLERKLANNCLDRLSIFAGPSGTGKTEAARVVARYHNCDAPDPKTSMPCGVCSGCSQTCGGDGSGKFTGYFEIDGADREDPQATYKRIYEFHRRTSRYAKSEVINSGDPNRGWVVFIDEAHRLGRPMREGLLTLVQRWHGAHIILATTNLEELAIRPDEALSADPLLQRAHISMFDYPTIGQAAAGIIRTSKTVGLTVAPSAAQWIASTHRGVPRNCLGEVNTLRLFSKDGAIDMNTIRDAYPES